MESHHGYFTRRAAEALAAAEGAPTPQVAQVHRELARLYREVASGPLGAVDAEDSAARSTRSRGGERARSRKPGKG